MEQSNNEKAEKLYINDVVIWCAGQYGKQLLEHIQYNGGNVCCFCDIDKEKQGKFVKGIPIYCFEEMYDKYPHALVVVAHSNYSQCIQIGNILERYGFVKNGTYFIALEMEIEGRLPLIKAPFCLVNNKIILLGPRYLCESFIVWAEEHRENIMICLSETDIEEWKQRYPSAFWIPLYRGPLEIEHEEKIFEYRQCLLEKSVLFTEWFLNHFEYCEKKVECRSIENDSVKKVLFNILLNNAGNSFIDGVLDSHPDILYFGLEEYVWTNNIWDIVKIAKEETGVGIVEKIVEKIKEYTLDAWKREIDSISVIPLTSKKLEWLDEYRYFLHRRINENRQYTEREIFVNMHLAWKEARHQNVTGKETVIYMDIHGSCIPWETYNMMVRWLEKMGFEVNLLQMIRRPYSQSASAMKLYIMQGNFLPDIAVSSLEFVAYEMLFGELGNYKIIRLRFEDVKQYPEIVLRKLCEELHILWNKSMLETTSAGKPTRVIVGTEETTGYNMKPVWYPYDEFFDAFDKFRIDILCREKCKAYDYPCVPEEKYPMSVDSLIELFSIPFQFERFILFESDVERKEFRLKVKEHCRKVIYWQKNKEHRSDLFCFGPYLSVD